VDSDVAEFRQLAKYPSLLESFISGNHNREKPEDMFAEARAIAWRELVMPEHQAAIEEYERLQGANPERVAHDKQSVLAAAEQGRIDKLLARLSRQTTDTVQDAADSVLRITFPEPEQGRTIHKLAAMVYQMRGKVVSLQPNEMPDGAPIVARLRY
jgi:hypothetical protein